MLYMKIIDSALAILILMASVTCSTSDASGRSTSKESAAGRISVGPIKWRGPGYEYARAVVTYRNTTSRTFKTVVVECVAKDSYGSPVSTHRLHFSTILGDLPITPGFERNEEAPFSNGSAVRSVHCYITRAN